MKCWLRGCPSLDIFQSFSLMTGGNSLSSTVTSLIWQLSIICVKKLRQGKPQWLSSVSHSWTAVETLVLANNGERGKFHFNRKLRTFPNRTVFLKWASRQTQQWNWWQAEAKGRGGPGFNIHSVDYSWGKGGGSFSLCMSFQQKHGSSGSCRMGLVSCVALLTCQAKWTWLLCGQHVWQLYPLWFWSGAWIVVLHRTDSSARSHFFVDKWKALMISSWPPELHGVCLHLLYTRV